MRKRTIAGLIAGGLLLGTSGALIAPSIASAHTQDVYCQPGNVVYVNLHDYPAGSSATITFDGLVVKSGTFGGADAPSLGFVRQVDPTVDHTVAVSVVGSDGVGTRDFSVQTAALCGYTPLPTPTPSTTPTPEPTTPPVTSTPTPEPTTPPVTETPTPTTEPTPPIVITTPTPTPTTTPTPGGTPSPTPTGTPVPSTSPSPTAETTPPASSGTATPSATPTSSTTASAVPVAADTTPTARSGELAFTGADGVIGGTLAAVALLALGLALFVQRRAARSRANEDVRGR
jgi:hypothetical protein